MERLLILPSSVAYFLLFVKKQTFAHPFFTAREKKIEGIFLDRENEKAMPGPVSRQDQALLSPEGTERWPAH